ncbi:acyltransferase family protein [Paenibacillus sp. CN-4]|uniref:acyltransferase family protein n=1 Tax=Paenibacillus nanchangensis TaxID=3348343 RepID=UPI00397BA964
MKKNVDYIDSLKGIGAILIAYYHISGLIGTPTSSLQTFNKIADVLSSIGYIPVEMFFFFSGYLMVYNYADKIKDIAFFEYIIKRIRTVYPFLMINLVGCSLYIIISGGNVSLYQILYNLLFLQSGYFPGGGDFRIDVAGGGTWFLAPLLLSYIIFFYVSKYKSEEKAFGVYGVIVIIGMIALKNNWNYPIFNGYMLRGLLGFFTGCLFSVVVKKYGFNYTKSVKVGMLVVFLAYLSLIVFGEYTNTIDFIVVTDVLILPCIIMIIESFGWLKKIIEVNFLRRLGKLSMHLFFLNLPVAYFFKLIISDHFTISNWVQIMLYLVCLLSFSVLLNFLIIKFASLNNSKKQGAI